MRLSDYFDYYEIEDLKGYAYALLAVIIVSAVFITILEVGRDALIVPGVS